ncbi:hypothetical protein [Ruegeria arenilitoris]|uniref:hypothetical protein n=1 Tax=Ruegeria arenilitoris TaxID=1173585 RepID=UPI00147E6B29|nr:hypothetical protein [Ruegeria arenilitoris]
MIVPKRWIRLSEIHQRISTSLLENEDKKTPTQNLEVKANELCWNFCESSKKVFLHRSGDKVDEMTKNYVEPPKAGTHLRANELVDLAVGVPGSGTKKYVAIGGGPKIYNISGPYIGSPILFERKEFEKFFLKIFGDATGSSGLSLIGVKNALLQKHKAGTYKNKEEEWDHYNGLVPKSIFNKAFKAAKQEDPSFGKVGKPPAKNKK